MAKPKNPASSFPGEITGQPAPGNAPVNPSIQDHAKDNFLADLAATKASNPFAEYHQLPDDARVIATGANFWDFEDDGPLFVGKFLSPVIAVGGEQEGEVIGYNTIGPDGKDRICPANYSIEKAVAEHTITTGDEAGKIQWGFCLWINFLGKTQSKKGQFSQFKIAEIPDFTKNNLPAQ